MNLTVIIPKRRGDTVDQRTLVLPQGTRYIVAEHDDGEWTDAVNEAAQAAPSEFVYLLASDAWVDPHALDFLTDLAWDADVTYGMVLRYQADGEQVGLTRADWFCPHRLQVENYLPELALFRREKLLNAGGVQSGMWDLYRRLRDNGARFKAVPEALAARLSHPSDPSLPPEPAEYQATFYHQATPGTTYWRCALPARYMPGVTTFSVPHTIADGDDWTFPYHHGAAVFQFSGDAAHYVLMRKMQEQGIRCLVEVDDNYLHPTPHMKAAGWYKTIADTLENSAFSAEGHRKTVAQADGVITTTEHMAKQYRRHNPNVYVCPNQIDPDDWIDYPKPDDGVLRIGWFASKSHLEDTRLVTRALDWASRQKNVRVVMVGAVGQGRVVNWRDEQRRLPTFKFPYEHRAWSNDFGVYRKMISDLDIGLAPVVGSPWANCRSDLKILELAMGETVTVASDGPPYKDWTDGDLCVKARNEKGFLDAVKRLVNHPDEAREMGRNVKQHVLEHRVMSAQIDNWRNACQTPGLDTPATPSPQSPQRQRLVSAPASAR